MLCDNVMRTDDAEYLATVPQRRHANLGAAYHTALCHLHQNPILC